MNFWGFYITQQTNDSTSSEIYGQSPKNLTLCKIGCEFPMMMMIQR